MNLNIQTRTFLSFIGLILILTSILSLGRNLSSFAGEEFLWKSIVENISLVLVCSGIFMLALLPLGSKYYGFPLAVMGIIGVFLSGYNVSSLSNLCEFFLSLTTMSVGYKLLLDVIR